MVSEYLVLGAGVTGLAAGVELKESAIVLEKTALPEDLFAPNALMVDIGTIMFYIYYILKTRKYKQGLAPILRGYEPMPACRMDSNIRRVCIVSLPAEYWWVVRRSKE